MAAIIRWWRIGLRAIAGLRRLTLICKTLQIETSYSWRAGENDMAPLQTTVGERRVPMPKYVLSPAKSSRRLRVRSLASARSHVNDVYIIAGNA